MTAAKAADEYPSDSVAPADVIIGDDIRGGQIFAPDGSPRMVTCSVCSYSGANPGTPNGTIGLAPVYLDGDPGINDEDARGETDS